MVKEEHRLRVENAPYGTLLERVQALVFPPPTRMRTRRSESWRTWTAPSLEDVRAFHDEYYRPDNATLVLVGDFKTEAAMAAIRRYFDPIPRSTKPFTRYPVPPWHRRRRSAPSGTTSLRRCPRSALPFPARPPTTPTRPFLK